MNYDGLKGCATVLAVIFVFGSFVAGMAALSQGVNLLSIVLVSIWPVVAIGAILYGLWEKRSK